MKHALTDGPLAGKNVLVPPGVDTHPMPDGSGLYRFADGLATWVAIGEVAVEVSASMRALAEALQEPVGLARMVDVAVDGERVLIVANSRKRAVQLLRAAAALSEGVNGASFRRANGAERLDFPSGGFIRPVGLNSTAASRGIAADVLYVDADVPEDDKLHAVTMSIVTSPNAAIVRHEGSE